MIFKRHRRAGSKGTGEGQVGVKVEADVGCWYWVGDGRISPPEGEILRIWVELISGAFYELHAFYSAKDGWDLPLGLRLQVNCIWAWQKVDPPVLSELVQKNKVLESNENLSSSESFVNLKAQDKNELERRETDKDLFGENSIDGNEGENEGEEDDNKDLDRDVILGSLESLENRDEDSGLSGLSGDTGGRYESCFEDSCAVSCDGDGERGGMIEGGEDCFNNRGTGVEINYGFSESSKSSVGEKLSEDLRGFEVIGKINKGNRLSVKFSGYFICGDGGNNVKLDYGNQLGYLGMDTGTEVVAELQRFAVSSGLTVEYPLSTAYRIKVFRETGKVITAETEIINLQTEHIQKFSPDFREALLWVWAHFGDQVIRLGIQDNLLTHESLEKIIINLAKQIKEAKTKEINYIYRWLKDWNYPQNKGDIFSYISQMVEFEPLVRDYGGLLVQGLFEERKSELLRDYIAIRTKWIEAHGSNYLKYLLENDYDLEEVYASERVSLEFRGFSLLTSSWQWRLKEHPTREEVNIATYFPNSRVIEVFVRDSLGNGGILVEPYILVCGFLGQYRIVIPVPLAVEFIQERAAGFESGFSEQTGNPVNSSNFVKDEGKTIGESFSMGQQVVKKPPVAEDGECLANIEEHQRTRNHTSPIIEEHQPRNHTSPVIEEHQLKNHTSPIIEEHQPRNHTSSIIEEHQPRNHTSSVIEEHQLRNHTSPIIEEHQPRNHTSPTINDMTGRQDNGIVSKNGIFEGSSSVVINSESLKGVNSPILVNPDLNNKTDTFSESMSAKSESVVSNSDKNRNEDVYPLPIDSDKGLEQDNANKPKLFKSSFLNHIHSIRK